MLPTLAEFRFAAHRINLVTHLVKSAINPLAFRLGIFGHDLIYLDTRLVECGYAGGKPLHQHEPFDHFGFGPRLFQVDGFFTIYQFLMRNQFRQDHRCGLQRFNLDILIAARLDMLHAQHAHRTLAINNRHARIGVEFVFTRFGMINEIRVRLGLRQIQRLDILGNRTGQPFAHRHAGDVNGIGVEALCRVEFQRAFAQQVDRADFTMQAVGDDLDNSIQLVLGMCASGHNLVQSREDKAGRGNRRHNCPIANLKDRGSGARDILARPSSVILRPFRSGPLFQARRPRPSVRGKFFLDLQLLFFELLDHRDVGRRPDLLLM